VYKSCVYIDIAASNAANDDDDDDDDNDGLLLIMNVYVLLSHCCVLISELKLSLEKFFKRKSGGRFTTFSKFWLYF